MKEIQRTMLDEAAEQDDLSSAAFDRIYGKGSGKTRDWAKVKPSPNLPVNKLGDVVATEAEDAAMDKAFKDLGYEMTDPTGDVIGIGHLALDEFGVQISEGAEEMLRHPDNK